jgi:transcriptional regulator with XRE-family HTH domain
MKKKSIVQKVAQKIRILRKIKKMSQVQLAEKARLHQTFIGKMERAEINPTIVSLEKVAKALNISLSELLTLPEDKKEIDTDTKTLNKAIEILEYILEEAKELTKD